MINNNKKPKKRFNIWAIFLLLFFVFVLIVLIQSSFTSSQFTISSKERENLIKNLNTNPKDKVKLIARYKSNFSSFTTISILFKQEMRNDKGELIFKKGQVIGLKLSKDNFEKLAKKVYGKDKIYQLALYDDFNLPRSWFTIIKGLFGIIGPTLLFIIALFILYKYMLPRGGGFGGIGTEFKGTELKKSNVKFLDVAGIVEEKKELIEVVDFLKNPKKYTDMGARIPKGVLLYGAPGTGKTLLAKAVSGESDVPFFSVSGSEFEETFVGLGASRIREMFRKAKKFAPCILFIDEIDSLGSRRQSGMGSKDQTLNQFLTEMDGFEPNEGIIVIGATNRTEILDPALLRSGRFDRKIQIPLPDLKAREEILEIHIKNKKIDNSVILKEIAEKTPGFSGAELENVLNEAALYSVRKNKTIISNKEIEEGIDRVIGGPAKISKVINPKTKLLVSIHEAGHALLGLMLSDAQVVQKVTIIPRGSAGGYTITTPKDETLINSKEALYHQVAGFLGGRAAEEIIFGEWGITTGAHDDFKKATRIVSQMVEKFGMSKFGLRYKDTEQERYFVSSKMSESKLKELDDSIDEILNTSFKLAKNTIKTEKELLLIISEALLILETITLNDIKFIYKNRELPNNAKEIKIKNPDKKYLDLSLVKKNK